MDINNKTDWYEFYGNNKYSLNGVEIFKPSEFYKLKKPTDLWMVRNTKIANAPLVGIFNFDKLSIKHFKKYYGHLILETEHIFAKVVDEHSCIIRGSTDGVYVDADQTLGITHREVKQWTSYSPARMRLIMGHYWDQILEWLDLFPDHIIEFSLFNKPVGIKKSPLVIWEIRRY